MKKRNVYGGRWAKVRLAFLNEHPLCVMWDTKNFQSLCELHHNSTKQRIEKSGKVIGCNADGIPLDPNSHWNK